MDNKVSVGIDLGTSKICALGWSVSDNCPVDMLSRANDSTVGGVAEGRHEQCPLTITSIALELAGTLCHKLLESGFEISGIGISGQMHGVLLADSELNPLTNLITWRDQRCLEPGIGDIAELYRSCSTLHPETINRIKPGYGGATLHWLTRNGLIPIDSRAYTIAGYLAAFLSSSYVTDTTFADSWGLLDKNTHGWNCELQKRLALSSGIFPELIDNPCIIGSTNEGISKKYGLPTDLPVCLPIGDNQASVIGSAGFSSDIAVLNIGTGAQISIPLSGGFPFYTEGIEIRPMPFGGSIAVGATLSGGWNYRYLMEFFRKTIFEFTGLSNSEEEIYSVMNRLASGSLPGSGGFVTDTRFSGTRSDPLIKGNISGIDLLNLTPGNMTRSFLEGMVEELWYLAPKKALATIQRIITSGNAVRMNPLLNEIIQNRFEIPVETAPVNEEAAVGAAMCCAKVLKLC